VPSSQESTQKKLENQELINLALDVLKPEERSVVVLRLMEGYSIKETAEIIGIKEGTVMSKLSRALKKMQTVLDDLK
jgi:RNA polymerase sigma-70 factor (ECF subfamily)